MKHEWECWEPDTTKGAFWEHLSLDQFNKGILTGHGEVSWHFYICLSATADCVVSAWRAPHREGLMDWVCLMCSWTRCLFVHVFLKSLYEESACRRRWTSGLQLGQCRGGNAEEKWVGVKQNAGASAAGEMLLPHCKPHPAHPGEPTVPISLNPPGLDGIHAIPVQLGITTSWARLQLLWRWAPCQQRLQDGPDTNTMS